MSLPTLVKNWEFIPNIPVTGDNGLQTWQALAIGLKNALTNTVVGPTGYSAHIYKTGSIELVGGTTFRVNPGDDSFNPTKIGDVEGLTIKIKGSTSAANNVTVPILSQSLQSGSIYALEFTNASGVAESVSGSVNVIGNDFTSPFVMRHSVKQTENVTPTAGDGVDRLVTVNDWTNIGSSQNSYWILQNPVTKTEFMLLTGNTTATGQQYGAARLTTAPSTFNAEPDTPSTSIPSGTLVDVIGGTTNAHISYIGPAVSSPVINLGIGARDTRLHVMISDDGEQMRAFWTYDGLDRMFMFDAVVRNPKSAWAADPETPVVAAFSWPGNGDSERAVFGIFNDLANATLSRLPSPTTGTLPKYVQTAYLSSEGYISAAVGQNLDVANELTGEWPFAPVGIVVDTAQYRGRMGTIPDMWWTSTGLSPGQTFPNNTQRSFIQVGDFVLPWSGDIPEFV